MEKLTHLDGMAVPVLAPNIDTDVITPMRRLTAHLDRPLADYAFEALRYVGGDADTGSADPGFPLNQPAYRGAQIMLCGPNFGCGSSRESAPAAIAALGIRCLIGSSFGDIFFSNCFQQGLLPIVLPAADVQALARQAERGGRFQVDLAARTIVDAEGAMRSFEIDALRQRSLMEGLDDIGLTLTRAGDIREWQTRDATARPWIYRRPASARKPR